MKRKDCDEALNVVSLNLSWLLNGQDVGPLLEGNP